MTKQDFIAKYEGWFSYTRREELKKEMETDLEEMFAALRQPPVIKSVCGDCIFYLTCKHESRDKQICVHFDDQP